MTRFIVALTAIAVLEVANMNGQTQDTQPSNAPQSATSRPSGPVQQRIAPRSRHWATMTSSMPISAVRLTAGSPGAQLAETLTHLAFYAGWPKATSALSALTRTLGK